ncbi:GNS1/SUR4 family [Popillia japonica]|uniref:Elongation of very long chain fatty acids protein n=1 Tax=Popillia japonica TaxID=7064 RepID=A0AAW1LX60_POPJA
MSSPFYTLGICISYVIIVKYIGPKFMENRKPLQLKNVLIVYNFLQVIFSTWLFLGIGTSGWLNGKYNWRCQPVDYSDDPETLKMVSYSWWYFFSKFTEFLDTFFFVLRKKNDHITTLHVIHHGVMPMSVWFGVKFTPGGHSTFFGFLNTFVHIVMYTYYMLSAFGPEMQKYLWWKKYLTTLQMVQFVGIMVHAFQLLFIDCNYPRAFVWWIGLHAVTIRRDNGARLPITIHRLQLPTCLRLVDRPARRHVLLPIQGILHAIVQQEEEGGDGGGRETGERER